VDKGAGVEVDVAADAVNCVDAHIGADGKAVLADALVANAGTQFWLKGKDECVGKGDCRVD